MKSLILLLIGSLILSGCLNVKEENGINGLEDNTSEIQNCIDNNKPTFDECFAEELEERQEYLTREQAKERGVITGQLWLDEFSCWASKFCEDNNYTRFLGDYSYKMERLTALYQIGDYDGVNFSCFTFAKPIYEERIISGAKIKEKIGYEGENKETDFHYLIEINYYCGDKK